MKHCTRENCGEAAVFNSEFCWRHLPDREAYREKLSKLIKENPSLKGANFARADLSNLDFSNTDLSRADMTRANLASCNFFNACLKDAELLGADLSGADLTSANLESADLTRSYLRSARLWHANLQGANLIEANLNQCDLWNARLFNVRLWRTEFSQAISLSKTNFRDPRRKYIVDFGISEKGAHSAEEAYRGLKKYFLANGRYDDASWASFKEKTMERLLLAKKKDPAYIPSLIMNFLCGYGEKPHRIIFASFFVILAFAAAFFLTDAVIYQPSDAYRLSISDYIYYSVITFTTVGYGDFIPQASFTCRAIASCEAFLGTFIIGLFIFTLARKYSAR